MESVSASTLAAESVPVRERAWLISLLGLLDSLLIPAASLVASLVVFALFILITGNPPFEVLAEMYRGAFGTWFSFQNTLLRAAPLMLTALCTALPARLGLIVIGGEGALVVGAVASILAAVALPDLSPAFVVPAMMAAGMISGGLWIAAAGALQHYRGVNETISTLLLNYIAIAVMSHLITGPMRDPEVVNRPSSWSVGEANMIGSIPGMDVHWGLVAGLIACLVTYVLMKKTV